jgi:isoleucyl-tRNA synthetase
MEKYDLTPAARMISDYVVDDVSNWYIRRNRRRFWKSGEWDDKLAAYQTLHEILFTIVKLIAPYTPFLAEDIYANLKNEPDLESVHFCKYPQLTQTEQDDRNTELENKMALAQRVVSISHSLRNDNKIRVRQPLSRLLVFLSDKTQKTALKEMEPIICDELNVKTLETVDSIDELIVKKAKPNFKKLGPKVGKLMGKIAPIINSFGDEQVRKFETNGFERIVIDGEELKISTEDVEILSEAKEGYATQTDNDLTIALDLKITEDLYNEGLARELINRIQNFRKEIDLAVTDRIDVGIKTESKKLQTAIIKENEYIKSETLATLIVEEIQDTPHKKEFNIGNDTLFIEIGKSKKN